MAYVLSQRHSCSFNGCKAATHMCNSSLAQLGVLRRSPTLTCSSSAGSVPEDLNADLPIISYSYNSSEGIVKQKATIENVFGKLVDARFDPQSVDSFATNSSNPEAPWNIGWQMFEKNMLWNDDLKARLVKRIASDELGISDEEMDWRLGQLAILLPGLQARLLQAPPKLVARLAAHTTEIAGRVLRLKQIFPQADTAKMLNNRLTLILDDELDRVAEAKQQLQATLPDINIDKFVEAFPVVLDVDSFQMAVEDARRIMPNLDLQQMLRSSPDTILSLIKGRNMIPYDEFANPWS